MKIKTFTFEDNSLFKFNNNYENEQLFRKDFGEYYFIKDTTKIDTTINEFIKGVEVVDIKVSTMVKGNNPPTSILVYTIIYKEVK